MSDNSSANEALDKGRSWQRYFLEIIRRFWFRGKIETVFVNSIVMSSVGKS